MSDNLAAINPSPAWDSRFCRTLQLKPIFCEHNVHTNYVYPTHQHLGVEFLYCQSGQGVIHLNGKPFPYSAPVLVQIESRIPHSVEVNGTYERWNICIELDALRRFLRTNNDLGIADSLHCSAGINMVPVRKLHANRLENRFVDIATELADCDAYYEDISVLQLQELALWFKRLAREAGTNTVAKNDAENRSYLESLFNLQSYIEANLANDISATQIAEALHYSEQHVYRMVQKLTGYSLGTYLKRQRILRAQSLLVATNLAISVVGMSVGIPNPSQFSHTFTEITGISPSRYRLLHRLAK